MLELYHAGLSQASVKVRTTLKEKGLAYKSHYLRLPEGEHLSLEYRHAVQGFLHADLHLGANCGLTGACLTAQEPGSQGRRRCLRHPHVEVRRGRSPLR